MWQQILHIDQQLLLALNGSWGGFWDTFFYIVTARLTWIPLYAAILYFAWRRIGTRNLLWMLVCLGVAVIAADQICNFFKHYTPKLRPSHTPAIEQFVHTLHGYRGGMYGTVSAHAAVSFTIAMFSARLFSRSWYTWTIMLWAALVCYSRIYAGLHYPMDILFGTALGLLLGAAAYRTYRKATAPRPEKRDGNASAASRETPKSLNDPNA